MVPRGIDTPALVVDVQGVEANIAEMARHMATRGVALRPHAKTHKSPDIARMQLAAGAAGLTVATLREAEVFARSGFDDIFVAYPLWPSEQVASRLRELCRLVRLRIGVESEASAHALADAGARGLEVLVELDSGQHRTGLPPAEAVRLAQTCSNIGLDVAGVFTHGGHAYERTDAPPAAARDETETIAEAVLFERAGLPVTVASAGSTPTARESATGPVNEERPGCYVFGDRQQVALGACDADSVCAFVAATVVSVSGRGHFVVDAGSKALSGDRPQWLDGFGSVAGIQGGILSRLWEHHGIVPCDGRRTPRIGDVVAIVPNHICTVVNLFDSYVLTSRGEVVGRWEVSARGV
jgi:D-serine deaminase-like pyridoxal phosphate-dependent protein